MRCPACDGLLPDSARFCPACGLASRVSETDATRTSVPERGASGVPTSDVPAVGAAGDAARFPPGTILAQRYRVVGMLGRGGMGEVYRADDLKLGRTVALKFLPESMERDPGRLVRLLNEVRTAVRVTHPNVCRVHDIAEFDGRHYLSMEYVDGEDLGTLLRRIGRLPGERAVRVARQLCAGLGAAHAQGVLHRDLKPANVMIDGRGEVKITDFGLAGAVGGFDGAEIRVGTPAYMAPEQVEGREVTIRSDLYALGLVLYELFSGKPAFADRTPDGIAARATSAPPSLTTAVDDVDPAVVRVVERCLSPDPEDRPPSAIAVSAALPGGDPLAAALAAGETPSPELVAEAGASGGLRVLTAILLLAAVVAGIATVAWMSSEMFFASRVGLDRSPTVLIDRAEQIVRDVGRDEALHASTHAWLPNWPYYQHVRTRDTAFDRWDDLARTRPAGLLFAFRGSPRDLMRLSKGSVGNWIGDPAPTTPGMVELLLDPVGRLVRFQAVPEMTAGGEDAGGTPGSDADFGVLFDAAGLDPAAFEPTEPRLHPRSFADRRYAWTGVDPYVDGDAPVELRIEASSLGGTPLTFLTLSPWELPSDDRPVFERSFWGRASDLIGSAWFLVVVIGAAAVAVRNVRLGRGDHRTALRFGLYLAGVRLLWLLSAEPEGDAIDTLTAHLAWSAYRLCLSYIFYMALEPYARRLWPEMLVSWVRVFGGRLRDARVGRDVLIGVATGCAIAVAKDLSYRVSMVLQPSNDGLNTLFWSWESLRGVRAAIVSLAGIHVGAVLDGLNGVMLFLVLRVVLRNTVAAAVGTTLFALVMFNPGAITSWSYLSSFTIIAALFWVVLFRAGLLAVLLAYSVDAILRGVRVTAEIGAWHALPMWLAIGTVLALAVWGFRGALAGRALFRDEIRATDAPV